MGLLKIHSIILYPLGDSEDGRLMSNEGQSLDLIVDEDNVHLSQYRNEKFISNTPKLESETFLEEYRALKQQQKDFLLKINMSAKLKQKIFGFNESKDVQRPDENEKLVVLVDPFKGRLIMKQKAWLQIEKQKESERLQNENAMYMKEQQQQEEIKKKAEKQKEKQKEKGKKSNRQNKQKKRWHSRNQAEQNQKNKDEEEQKEKEKEKSLNFLGSFLKRFSTNKSMPKAEESDEKQKHILEEDELIEEGGLESYSNMKRNRQEIERNRKNFSKGSLKSDHSQNFKSHRYQDKFKSDSQKKATEQKKLKYSPEREKIRKQRSEPKKEASSIKLESRSQAINKYNDEYELISEIPKKDMRQQFSNPSIYQDKQSDSENLQPMIRSKANGSKDGWI